MGHIPERFYLASVAEGRPAAMQAEFDASWESLRWTALGWGELGWADLDQVSPRVAVFKWLQRRRMTTICRRWDQSRHDAIQHAWFNGIGYVAWENVWGTWNGISPRDGEAIRRLQPLLRFFGGGVARIWWVGTPCAHTIPIRPLRIKIPSTVSAGGHPRMHRDALDDCRAERSAGAQA